MMIMIDFIMGLSPDPRRCGTCVVKRSTQVGTPFQAQSKPLYCFRLFSKTPLYSDGSQEAVVSRQQALLVPTKSDSHYP
jgi:hypothetical protein